MLFLDDIGVTVATFFSFPLTEADECIEEEDGGICCESSSELKISGE